MARRLRMSQLCEMICHPVEDRLRRNPTDTVRASLFRRRPNPQLLVRQRRIPTE